MCEVRNDAEVALKNVNTKLDDEIGYLIYMKGIYTRSAEEWYRKWVDSRDVACRKTADKYFESGYKCHKAIKVLESLKEQIEKEIM